ncbi:hypothetical protein [Tolypothrix sp. NIES-4075]|uniref:hypothetical protein n=1 Tax=Tolypothrix sp. NIES-4075 TaxID=2005459 RepID=UPI00190EDCB0|nr:hypothetical protein [Tolypothrix sp. NIES-4075]
MTFTQSSNEGVFRGWILLRIIVWIDVEKGQVSLSTSDLETESGDMLTDPLLVYEKAEEMAARYYQNVLSRMESE